MSTFSELVAEDLCGTCLGSVVQSCDSVIEWNPNRDFAGLTEDDIDWNEFNNIVFECADCGWWCEAGDCGDEDTENGTVCGDCWRDNHATDDE